MKSSPLLIKFYAVIICITPLFNSYSQDKQQAILVTGSSSGIGLRITEVLSQKGYLVYAGARKQEDLDRLNKMENVESVKLDVNKQEQIDAAVDKIKKAGRGLFGVVNNAGVAVIAPLIEVPEEDFHFQMNVNVYGPYRITKAFAPMIIESTGRFVTIGSISGILPGPLYGPYSMSKHAVEGFTDVLANEMERFNVSVSVVEPGSYNSKISASLQRRIAERNPSFENSLYKSEMEALVASGGDRSNHKDPIEVANAVLHALSSEKPQRRYMVVPNERQAELTIRHIMREMLELNQNQPYEYDKESLIKMMNEMMAEME